MSCIETPVNDDCVFCKIIAGAIPCARVFEDEHVLAFLDISPVAKGHTLVIPKGHYPTLLDVPVCVAEPLVHALKLVAAAVQEETQSNGFNCLQNNFSAAGQEVFHAHWHIIPRAVNDGLSMWTGKPYSDSEEMHKLATSVYARITAGPTGG